MAREIGWGPKEILLWQIKKEIEKSRQAGAAVPTTTTTSTSTTTTTTTTLP